MKLLFLYFTLFYGTSYSILLNTNIGKFFNTVHGRIQNKTLTLPNNVKVNRNILESAFKGFRNVVDDPLVINEQKLHYEMKDVLKLKGYIRNLNVKYLKNMTLDHVFISDDNLYSEFIIRVPTLEIGGLYNTSCYLKEYEFDIYGNGSFKWIISDFQIKVNFTLNKMRQTEFMQLDKIDWDQSIGNSKFEIKNLLNDEAVSSVVSDVLTVIIPTLHNYFKPVINEFVVRLVILYSDILFSNLKTKEFIGVLYAFGEKANSRDNKVL